MRMSSLAVSVWDSWMRGDAKVAHLLKHAFDIALSAGNIAVRRRRHIFDPAFDHRYAVIVRPDKRRRGEGASMRIARHVDH